MEAIFSNLCFGSGRNAHYEHVVIPYDELDFTELPVLKDLKIEDDEAVRFLVYYSGVGGAIFVDKRAPDEYKKLAVLHETICQGGNYEDWAGVEVGSIKSKCSMIDYAIYKKLCGFYDVDEYLRCRLKMYRFLIINNINPTLNDRFLLSVDMIEGLLAGSTEYPSN